jgi:hypothetical protein
VSSKLRRRGYLVLCAVVLLCWIWFGHFEAVEAPYVKF